MIDIPLPTDATDSMKQIAEYTKAIKATLDSNYHVKMLTLSMLLAFELDNFTEKGGTVNEFWAQLANSTNNARAITNYRR